jgi:hypothetical protein
MNLDNIKGNNIIVEVDETKVGRNKYNRDYYVKGAWCLGMVERMPERRIDLTGQKS